MMNVIEDILRKKPHLEEPFRFYEKAVKFNKFITALPLADSLSRNTYNRELIDPVFERFSEFLNLPEGSLDPLRHAMELGEVDFMRLPLGEVPAFSLPYPEDDLSMLLFLLSRPYFLALANLRQLDNRTWEEGKCPVCGGRPSVSWIGDEGRRTVSCSYCATSGYVIRSGCPLCHTADSAKQKILIFEDENEYKINTCSVCGSYVKSVNAATILKFSPDVVDLISLPLDIVTQDKGFARRSPNPVGMRKITSRG